MRRGDLCHSTRELSTDPSWRSPALSWLLLRHLSGSGSHTPNLFSEGCPSLTRGPSPAHAFQSEFSTFSSLWTLNWPRISHIRGWFLLLTAPSSVHSFPLTLCYKQRRRSSAAPSTLCLENSSATCSRLLSSALKRRPGQSRCRKARGDLNSYLPSASCAQGPRSSAWGSDRQAHLHGAKRAAEDLRACPHSNTPVGLAVGPSAPGLPTLVVLARQPLACHQTRLPPSRASSTPVSKPIPPEPSSDTPSYSHSFSQAANVPSPRAEGYPSGWAPGGLLREHREWEEI